MWIYDLETLNFLEVNEAAVKHYGYSRAEFLRMRLSDIRPKEDVARLKAHMRAKRQRLQYSREWQHLKKDGTVIYVDIISHKVIYKGHKAALIVAKDTTESKQIDKVLRESQAELMDVAENAMDAIIMIDDAQRIVLFNPAAEAMFQRSATEIIGKSLNLLLPRRFRTVHKKHVLNFGKTGTTKRSMSNLGRLFGLRADGTEFPIEVSISTAKISGEKLYTAIVRDISQRVRSEKTLQESEERFRSLYENTTIGIYRTTPDGQILMSNPALVKMLGYEFFEDLAKRNLEKDGSDAEYSRKEFKQQIEREGMIQGREASWKTKNGNIINVRESAQAVRDNHGKVLYYEGTIEDITGRKKAEDALHASESELRAIFETIPDVIIVLDKDGRYLKIAPSNPDLLYLPAEDLLGKRIHDIFPRENADQFLKYIRRALRTRATVRFEYELLVRDKTMWFSGTTTPLTKDTVVWVVRDITSQKQVEEQTQRRLIELQVLYESGLAFGHTMDVHAIGERIIQVIKKHLSWHHAVVRLLRDDSDEVELIAFSISKGRNKPSVSLKRALTKISRIGQGLSGWAMKHGEAVRVGDVTTDARYVETFAGAKSGLYVPLKIGEIAIGVISVESDKFEAFDEDDERLLTTLAAQAAAAIQNARLFHQAQRRAIEVRYAVRDYRRAGNAERCFLPAKNDCK